MKPGGGQRPPSEKGEKGGIRFPFGRRSRKNIPMDYSSNEGVLSLFFARMNIHFSFFAKVHAVVIGCGGRSGGASKPPLSLLATCPAYVLRALCHRNREKISSVPLRNRHGPSGLPITALELRPHMSGRSFCFVLVPPPRRREKYLVTLALLVSHDSPMIVYCRIALPNCFEPFLPKLI